MDLRTDTIFAPYFTTLDAVVDRALDVFAPLWYPQYFDLGIPTFDLTYTTVVGRSRVEAAASVIALDASSPKRSITVLDRYQGNLAPLSATYRLSQAQIRNWHQLMSLKMVSDQAKMNAVLNIIFDTLTKAGNAPHKRLDFMCLQALSTGKIDLNVGNNPDGVVDTAAIDLLMNPLNKLQAYYAWSDPVNSTPLTDIMLGVVIPAWKTRGLKFAKILMDLPTFYHLQQSAETKSFIHGFYLGTNTGGVVGSLNQVNSYLEANQMPVIELVTEIIGIESDGVVTPTNPWAAGQVTFIPEGKLGTIHNAWDIEQIQPVSGISYATYKGALLSKWSETDPFNDFSRGSFIAFPGLELIDHIFILDSTTGSHVVWPG